ncbi:MAG: dephospho-CoA kinase [Robiginitomaculum sp.]|nr:MAG: dephospho-CoA kinase [Robiginitomaculum sp.]
MIILGLTGSIGMGKTTTAALFNEEGVPVFDVDAAVHRLYSEDIPLIKAIGTRFPKAIGGNTIDRTALGDLIREDKAALPALEAIVHPAVARARADWLEAKKEGGAKVVLFDIPLLFETGGEKMVDKVIVVSAPKAVQKQRVLSRPNMSEARFSHLLSCQMPDEKKRKCADFIIDTSKGLEDARRQVQSILRQIKTQNPTGKDQS